MRGAADFRSTGEPLVSVIMPVYNRDWCVGRAIESVLNQTYARLELIVVDDGSTDESLQVIERYGPSVTLLRQSHAGAYAARNLGHRHARGALIAFADSDDAWFPDRLASQVPLMCRREVGVVYGDVAHFAEARDGAEPTGNTSFRISPPHRGNVSAKLVWRNFVPTCAVLVRRSCLDEIGGFRETHRVSADYLAWFQISLRHEFDYVERPVCAYTVHRHGISSDLGASLKARIGHFSAELEQASKGPERAMLRQLLFNLSLHLLIAAARGRAGKVRDAVRLAVRTGLQTAKARYPLWAGAFMIDQLRVRARRLI